MVNEPKSFFSQLFDLSFSRFVTPSIIRVVFIIAIIAAGLGALGTLGTASLAGGRGGGGFLLGLIMAVVAFFVSVIVARISLEAVVALFRIAENTRTLAEAARREMGQSGD